MAQSNETNAIPIYRDPGHSVIERVEDLLSRMTLDEKVAQLRADISQRIVGPLYKKENGRVEMTDTLKTLLADPPVGKLGLLLRADPFVGVTSEVALAPRQAAEYVNEIHRFVLEETRLGIPILISNDNSRCHVGVQATIFPAVRNMGCTWNRDLINRVSSAIASESRSRGETVAFAPDLDVIRDPRLGRSEENYGEDPYLVGQMGVEMVRGLQGDSLNSNHTMVAMLRAYPGAGDFDGGHDFSDTSRGINDMQEVGLRPWGDAVRAGAEGIMVEFATYDRVPAAASHYLLTDLLRNEWGFKGFTMTDSWAVRFSIACRVAKDRIDAAALSLKAGIDQSSPDGVIEEREFGDTSRMAYGLLPEVLEQGLISMEDIDRAVRRVLRVKFLVGLFDDPYVDPNQAEAASRVPDHLAWALDSARQSMVLLENERRLLPLRKDLAAIAVIGPNADDEHAQLGDLCPPHPPEIVTTVLQGIQQVVSENTVVHYARGCGIRDLSRNGFAEAVEVAKQSDVVIAVVGGSSKAEYVTVDGRQTGKFSAESDCGESGDRATLDLMGVQQDLLKELKETGKPLVVVLIHGRTMTINWIADHADAVVDAGYPGEFGGQAVGELLFGDLNPGGRLTVSIPKHVGQLPVHYYRWIREKRDDYVEMEAGPRYPFGYGLSYTSFEYRNLTVEPEKISAKEKARVSTEVTNTGNQAGDEVVQLYIRDELSSVARPFKLLRGFQRIHLEPGETKVVTMELGWDELCFYGPEGKWIVEPGDFTIMISKHAEEDILTAKLTVYG